jgi:glycosyltransferase involved in cell wall biosynthesis
MKKKVLAIYRGKLSDQRGTPNRVRSLLSQIQKDERVELFVASWDESFAYFPNHTYLTNGHLEDIRKLLRIVRQQKIDVVILHTVAPSYYGLILQFLSHTKLVLEMHGVVEDEAREYGDIGPVKYWLYKIWYSFLYWRCDLIVTCSKSITDIVGRFNGNSFSLTGGVDLGAFKPTAQSGHYFTKDDRIVIGYAGNARKWQGLDFLIRVYEKLSKETNGYRLVLLLSEKKGLDTGGLEVYGPIENTEVPGFLVDCDILVVPRPLTPVTRISFPSKIPEYLAMGKAVVAANTGDADAVIVSGHNGMLYTPEDEEGLLEMFRMLGDRGQRESMGMAAAESAQILSWPILATQFIDKIIEVL